MPRSVSWFKSLWLFLSLRANPWAGHSCLHWHVSHLCLVRLLIPLSYQCTTFVLLQPLYLSICTTVYPWSHEGLARKICTTASCDLHHSCNSWLKFLVYWQPCSCHTQTPEKVQPTHRHSEAFFFSWIRNKRQTEWLLGVASDLRLQGTPWFLQFSHSVSVQYLYPRPLFWLKLLPVVYL